MGQLVFIGLGLSDENDVSLRGLDAIREADAVFAEFYTSFMPNLSIRKLEQLAAKRITILSRSALEDKGGQLILQKATRGKVAFLVPGDPLIATTHIDLRIRAEQNGITTRIVHGASILSAAIGLSGLQNYKYGKSVTIPFTTTTCARTLESPRRVIRENQRHRLHTLCYLDIQAERQRYMTIHEGLQALLALERDRTDRVITSSSLVVGIARAGFPRPTVKAGYVSEILTYPFGPPPHILIFPGSLHFMEAEALITLADAPSDIRTVIP